jgi:hypothetical protein
MQTTREPALNPGPRPLWRRELCQAVAALTRVGKLRGGEGSG